MDGATTKTDGATPPQLPTALQTITGEFRLGPALEQNTGHTVWSDGRVHHTGYTTVFSPNTVVPYIYDGDTYDIDMNSQQEGRSLTNRTYAAVTSRSYHAETVNVALMDGSVRGVSDSVARRVWRALGTRAGTRDEVGAVGEL